MISGVPNLGFSNLVQSMRQELPRRDTAQASPETRPSNPPEDSTKTGNTVSSAPALTPEQQQQVDKLAAADRAVRAHELAHLGAGAGLVLSGPSYQFATGPDKKTYAVGGEVQIDSSPGRTPEESLQKAQRIRAAALAPVDPSPQDQRVAAVAGAMEAEARAALALAGREGENGSRGKAASALAAYGAGSESGATPRSGFDAFA